MKLVDVNEFYAEQGGGVRTYVDAKLEAGSALGHEVVVIAPGPEDREERRKGGRVLWVASRPMPVDPRYYMLLRERAVHELLDVERPDVVEGSSPWTGGLFCARWRGAALKSFVFHQDPVAVYPQTLLGGLLGGERVERLCGGYYRYLRALSRRYDLTVTAGAWLAERLHRHGVQSPVAVPFGVEKGAFAPELADRALRRELLAACGQPEDASLVVTASRHHPEKRIFTMIDIVARAQRTRPIGFAIFGDGPLRKLVEHKARRLAGVRVMGRIAGRLEMARTLASADALLHGSSAETFGIVVAEALSAGLPLCVPDQGGAAELARADYAETYPAGDVESGAQALLRLLARPQPPLRAAAAAAGERLPTVEAHFAQLFGVYGERLRSPERRRQPGR